ncbi:MAG: insulinase family protein [Chloroflexi bacterium]|nr:insulinase family protein [Chloroflexota bacterium]
MVERTVLPNGLRLLTECMPHTRSVSICYFVGAGSRYEGDAEAGVSHYVEHMLFKGSQKRPSSMAISSAIEEVGGSMNGSTEREFSSYWCKVARPHFLIALDVLTDLIVSPLLDPAEMERERGVIQEELGMTNDYPGYRMEMLIDEMLWPNQPMGRDVGGTKESVQGITHAMLADYYRRQYVPSNAVLGVAGEVSHGEVVEAVEALVRAWPPGKPRPWYPAGLPSQTAPQTRLERRKTEQAHLGLALPGIPTSHPDRYALDMLSAALGEGMSSRLFMEVRERRGLAYDIHSSVNHFRDTGSFMVSSGVDPKKGHDTVTTILEELRRVKDGVSQEELNRARELVKGRLLLRMEDTRAVAAWAGVQELLHDLVMSVDDVVARLEEVTPEKVQRAANDYLVAERLNLAVVGPYRSQRLFHSLLRL